MSDFNSQVIDEFRANAGKVGGYFEGKDLLLLHTTGAKSGAERVSPVAYVHDGDKLVIIASKAGADTDPDWYRNLVAHPSATVEVGTDSFPVTATPVSDGPERDRLYALMVAAMPGFAEYETKTSRVIPAVLLTRS